VKTQLLQKVPAEQRLAVWLIISLSSLSIIGLAFYGPIAQDIRYHQFADQRILLGVAYFWNVITNFPFIIVGIAGLLRCKKIHDHPQLFKNIGFYQLFFLGIALTGFTSAYYHLQPDNIGLFWDRLTMALSFAALFGAVIGDFVDYQLALRLKLPLVSFALLSVGYWIISEFAGVGDLRPYILTQFLPILIIPVIVISWESIVIKKTDIVLIGLSYAVAKLLEFGDYQLYYFTYVSGHTLKHIAAVASAFWVYRLLCRYK